MEWIVVLFLLVVFGGLALLILAYKNSAESLREISRLKNEIRELKRDLYEMKQKGGPTPQPGAEPPRPVSPAPRPAPVQQKSELTGALPAPDRPRVQIAAEPIRAPAAPEPELPAEPMVDWEKFTGVRLFSWLGGFALFLGAAFFVKYSIEHDLISPLVRVALGFVLGVGTIAAGLWLKPRGYSYTVDALCASGVAVLYANIFAANSFYRFIGTNVAFLLMVLVTAAAFLLSVRLSSKYVALLGLVGGFLTPPLLSTGVDRPLGLFGYIAVLNIGLAATALRQKWGFLVGLAALGTLIIEVGWVSKFFAVSKAPIAVGVFTGFSVLFMGVLQLARRWAAEDRWVRASAASMPLVSMVFTTYLLSFPELGARPGLVLSFLFVLDACVMALCWIREDFRKLSAAAGGIAFLVLLIWTTRWLTVDLLYWGLGYYFAFAALHSVTPVLLQRKYPAGPPSLLGNLYPAIMLALTLIPLVKEATAPILVWPFILAIDLIALVVVFLTAWIWAGIAVLGLTFVAASVWMNKMSDLTHLPELLWVLGGFALVFFLGGLYLRRRMIADGTESASKGTSVDLTHLSALAGLLPFLLLSMAAARLPLADPSPVFGLGLLLSVLLLALVRSQRSDMSGVIGLISAVLLETTWHVKHFDPASPLGPLGWYTGFFLLYTIFPFLFSKSFGDRWIPWAVGALAGPAHFYIFHNAVTRAIGESYIGVLPAIFAAVSLAGLVRLLRIIPAGSGIRLTALSFFGGVTLLFVSLIFPLQFEKEWITLGWAIEGMALLWLFHRVPHEGLKVWGVALLAIAFARLALNPAVLEYHPRAAQPIFNWYLYAYGTVILALLGSARLLAPPRHLVLGRAVSPALNLLAAVLGFLLLNIEIADYFSAGSTLTFKFSGNLARDMCYSLGWALYGLSLFLIGIRAKNRGARFGGLGLLCATVLKVFFHDLWQMGQLYRVASFVGLAAILILVSFLYQRYVSKEPS